MARKVLTITVVHDSPVWDYHEFCSELVGILRELQGSVSETISVRFSGMTHPTDSFVAAEMAYANEVFASVLRIGAETEVVCRVPGFESYTGGCGELSGEDIRARLVTCLARCLRHRAKTADALMARESRELDELMATSKEIHRADGTPTPAA